MIQQAYFSNIRENIILMLEGACAKVQIAMAWFTSAELYHTLKNLLHRGIEVELVLLDNPINFMEYAPDFNDFIKAGGRLYLASSEIKFMHHKFCIIDNSIAITGSYNWTYYAETRNIENILVTDDKNIVNLYSKEFSRLIKVLFSSVCSVQRYTWEEIENMDEVDSTEINHEIKCISKIQKRPIRIITKTKTQIRVSKITQHPFAVYNFGVVAVDNPEDPNSRLIPMELIKNDTPLPFTSEKIIANFNYVNHSNLFCQFYYGVDASFAPLCEEDNTNLIDGVSTADNNCEIEYQMTLDIDGTLRIDMQCLQSAKRKTITTFNPKFVKYE